MKTFDRILLIALGLAGVGVFASWLISEAGCEPSPFRLVLAIIMVIIPIRLLKNA